MDKTYQAILQRINKIDFNTLWPGFIPYEFALYNDEKVYFETKEMPVTNEFMGNTSIKFEGKQIAIWKIEDEDVLDLDYLAAALVHEMFHAHQFHLKDSRFSNELDGFTYPLESVNLSLKAQELSLLSRAVIEETLENKAFYFNEFLAVRLKRFDLLGPHANYEKGIETIEGTAEYITLSVLRAINIDAYNAHKNRAINYLNTLNEHLLDIRRTAYFSGAFICILADELVIDYKTEIVQDLPYNFDLITQKYAFSKTLDVPETVNPIVAQLIDAYSENTSKLVSDILTHEQVSKVTGAFTIKGYDPMNMKAYKNYVYHKHFLAMGTEDETAFVMGPLVIETDGMDYSKFSAYYKIGGMQNDA